MEENERKIKEDSLIDKLRLKEYNSKNYLVCTFRFSVLEKIITKLLFQLTGSKKEYDLNQDYADKKFLKSVFSKMFIEIFGAESPLYFYSQLAKELLRLFKIEDVSKIKFDDYILKLEFLLAWHFENNFYPRTSIFELIESLNDNIYLSNGVTNYIYSVESINTIDHFLRVFEKQSLCTRIAGDLDLINNLFCSEKVYYFYCEKANKDKIPCGNMIKYLLEQLNTKITKNKNNKINSIDIENYIMMNLYLIDKIIQYYTFYLYRDPEIVDVFNSLEVFKAWPSPISNYCNRVIENIINENYFQGISLLNKLRQEYYLDLIDNDITSINTKIFKYTLIV